MYIFVNKLDLEYSSLSSSLQQQIDLRTVSGPVFTFSIPNARPQNIDVVTN